MPGTPAPDAVLLVLDSLHLRRQLMLAAPVLSLGLPTLVLLNMSDLMETRGGEVDTLALAQELGVPVAKISASRGTGLDAITHFLDRKSEVVQPRSVAKLELPVVGNARSYRQWATGISTRTKYKAPLSSEWTRKLDRILLHRIVGPLLFLAVVISVFQVVFSIGQPLSNAFGDSSTAAGARVGTFLGHGWFESLLIDGIWKGVASVLVFLPQILLLFPVHRSPRRLRLSGPRRAHRRSRHALYRAQWQGFYSLCSPPMPARFRPLWPRAPSRTSAIASRPSSSRRS